MFPLFRLGFRTFALGSACGGQCRCFLAVHRTFARCAGEIIISRLFRPRDVFFLAAARLLDPPRPLAGLAPMAPRSNVERPFGDVGRSASRQSARAWRLFSFFSAAKAIVIITCGADSLPSGAARSAICNGRPGRGGRGRGRRELPRARHRRSAARRNAGRGRNPEALKGY